MTRLISQFEASFGVSEDDEADRLHKTYGWARACRLAEVFEKTCPRVYRAFWFRVSALLADMPDGIRWLPKEREVAPPPTMGPKAVTVDGVRVTRAAFLRFLEGKKEKARA